jgi:hypothetical protein
MTQLAADTGPTPGLCVTETGALSDRLVSVTRLHCAASSAEDL